MWKDIKSVVTHKPSRYPSGELQVRADRCDGELLATMPLGGTTHGDETSHLNAPLHAQGRRDLCFRFATGGYDPLWVIDSVQLKAGE
ncbi:MAG: hypothetical protein E6K53_02035 [Gammaproteobacteria bacterium]|nr:MAG: hypothetical protein E6K53_02035 [Gammaproteobacteria bacterium]